MSQGGGRKDECTWKNARLLPRELTASLAIRVELTAILDLVCLWSGLRKRPLTLLAVQAHYHYCLRGVSHAVVMGCGLAAGVNNSPGYSIPCVR
jgi:hypothetical protein